MPFIFTPCPSNHSGVPKQGNGSNLCVPNHSCWEFKIYVNSSFCFKKFAFVLAMWMKTLYGSFHTCGSQAFLPKVLEVYTGLEKGVGVEDWVEDWVTWRLVVSLTKIHVLLGVLTLISTFGYFTLSFHWPYVMLLHLKVLIILSRITFILLLQ